ncbi:MAG: beta strand repeat-containing protein [Parachlamydiaceae bacterium]
MVAKNTTLIQSLYARGPGTTASDPFITIFSERDPTPTDINYPIQKRWVNIPEAKEWMLISFTYDQSTGRNLANWLILSNQGSGSITLTGDTGDVVNPLNGNIDVVGDGTYITTDGDDSSHTLSISLIQGSVVEGVTLQSGTSPVVPAANGLVTFNGSSVGAGTNPVRTNGTDANTIDLQVQISQAVASSNANHVGLAAFNSDQFSVDENGFVTLAGGTTPSVLTMSDDVNTIVSPSGTGNIQLVGHINEQGSTKFSTIDAGTNLLNINPMSSARWIVDPLGFNGTHTTLTSALASATSGDTIFIVAGATLTENVTLKAGVNITALTGDQITPNVTIIGNCTASFAGTCTISNIRLQTNSAACLTVSGSSATTVNLYNVYINATNATAISFSSSSSSSTIRMVNCLGNIGATGIALFSQSSAGTLGINYCNFANTGGSSTASTISAGMLIAFASSFSNPITSSGTSTVALQFIDIGTSAQNVTSFTNGGSGNATTIRCRFVSGSASAVSTSTVLTSSLCAFISSNTNSITGSGTIIYSNLSFTGRMNVSSQIGQNTASGGISFDGGINVLNHYEEGTFTPTLIGQTTAGTTTYTAQNGYYTRIGNQVTIWGSVQGSAATGTGNALLGGFPFTIKNQTNGAPVGTFIHANSSSWTYPTNTTQANVSGIFNSTTANIYCSGSGGAVGLLQMANSTFTMFFTLTYQI